MTKRELNQIQDKLKEIIQRLDKISKETTKNTTKLDNLQGYQTKVDDNIRSINWLTWAVRLIIGSLVIGTAGWIMRGLV